MRGVALSELRSQRCVPRLLGALNGMADPRCSAFRFKLLLNDKFLVEMLQGALK